MLGLVETFVINVWTRAPFTGEEPGVPASELRGLVRHIASGDSEPFRSADELVRLLRKASNSRTAMNDREG
jgi:hypothetical protein